MQSQEGDYSSQEHKVTPVAGHTINNDPREQPSPLSSIPPYTYQERSYEDGYTSQYTQDDAWFREAEGEKLRPQAESRRGMRGILSILAVLFIGIIIGNLIHVIGGWIIWTALIIIVLAGATLIASNWRVITIPMPVETFPIQEHAQLIVNNFSGTISVRKGNRARSPSPRPNVSAAHGPRQIAYRFTIASKVIILRLAVSYTGRHGNSAFAASTWKSQYHNILIYRSKTAPAM
ncbi:hypothetical protein KDK_35300 [Dictyobacter kobayashii]|uniref:Uncharacterized protein n=1 Tax=Dictyobacter kobayashii TaxID=2014872 RepID=A0A402AL45_9CHLR|nr:hypothetical protein KDK_35300 [Dictyobacter kobayashii]